LRDAQSQISELAVLAAEKILNDKSGEAVNSAIYDSFISETGDEK
jgi:F0F1-type ATP synthase membrane subunit b/b'